MGDIANYEQRYADMLQEGLNQWPEADIKVQLFNWGGENLHISRADGAVRLLDELAQQQQTGQLPRSGRVLLWGHSHAGNVFALLSNLVGSQPEARERFFRATRSYYVFHKKIDRPAWKRVKQLLSTGQPPLGDLKVDMVTFGTPIRYGWDTDGCGHLLHWVNHHPVDKQEPYKAVMPHQVAHVQQAFGGDYFQHMGIAGSGFLPSIFSLSSWCVEHRLRRLLESGVRKKGFFHRLSLGVRVPEDGLTLLTDYGQVDPDNAALIGGHAIYTRQAWMAYHASEIAKRFYS